MINATLHEIDKEIHDIIKLERKRQNHSVELIASENFVSKAVLEVQGTCLTNKYAEGYPGRRYYGGCDEIDKCENLAIQRVKKLFNCEYANVQPHSGSQANQAIFLGFLNPGDTILGMSLDSGGHLTHGANPNISGKWFNAVHYGVNPNNYLIDYDQIESLAKTHKPKLIIAGYSCYPRQIDFAKFREIADKVGAYLLADIAHIAGLVATNHHQSPLPYADFVTSTTHKTLRGPRGGLILSNNVDLAKKINSSIFPGLQGGPLMHVIAAKAVSFQEALRPDYDKYIKQVISNARALSDELKNCGYNILTGGSDNHMVVVDLRDSGITGQIAETALDTVGITCNKNTIPFDQASPFVTSGIRLGTPACTTRGFMEEEFANVAEMIAITLNTVKNQSNVTEIRKTIANRVSDLTNKFPLYW